MTPKPAVLVHLLLKWSNYLHFNSDIVNFVWKTNEGGGRGAKSIVLLIFDLLMLLYLLVGEGFWVGRKSLI